MKLEQFEKLLLAENSAISSVKASSLKREIKNMLKSLVNMDAYKDLSSFRLLDVFMTKFDRHIKANNLNRSNIRLIAKNELEVIKNRNG